MMRLPRGYDADNRVWGGQMVESRGRRFAPWVRRVLIVDMLFGIADIGYRLLQGWGDAERYGRGFLSVGAVLIGFVDCELARHDRCGAS